MIWISIVSFSTNRLWNTIPPSLAEYAFWFSLENEGGVHAPKAFNHEWWIYLKRTQYYVIKTFVIRQNTANDVCYTYYHKVRAWPSLPIMNSIQDTSRFPKKPQMARFSVLWFGSCIQLMSNKSQTLATQPHQWSFVCLLFEGRQTRGFSFDPWSITLPCAIASFFVK